MTLQETRDNFIAELDFEYQKRGVNRIIPSDKIIAAWIAEAETEITDSISPIKSYTDIIFAASSSYQTQNLPTNFGCALRAECNGVEIPFVSYNDLQSTGALQSGQPTAIAVYFNGTNWVAAINTATDQTYTIRLWYNVSTLYYSPSGTSAQNWGTFDGVTYTGNLKVPDKYYRMILDYLLGKFFPEFMQKFQIDKERKKADFSHTTDDSLPYKFAGVTN